MEITFRKASKDDLALLDRIHTQNMREYVEQNYPWDKHLFKKKFIPSDYLVLQKQKLIIGFLKIVPEANSLYLGEIQIKNLYQNQGIGTKILQFVIEQNKFKYQRIWLQILKGNPAIRLYQRLGFKIFIETKTHYKMQLICNSNNQL